jgi:hypothetical protein
MPDTAKKRIVLDDDNFADYLPFGPVDKLS